MINKNRLIWTSDTGWEKWRLRFGKHCGRPLAEIVKDDPNYLIWLNGAVRLNDLDAPRVEAAMLAALTARRSSKAAEGKTKKRRGKP
jgi:hypothetical protein